MKLTGELKDKVTKAETKEEKKDIIAQAGMELTDDELDMVAGGNLDFGSMSGDELVKYFREKQQIR